MRKRSLSLVLVAALAFGLTGMDDRPADALYGTWNMNFRKMLDNDEDYKKASPEKKKFMEGLMEGMASKMAIVIEPGKIFMEGGPQDNKREETLEIVSTKGDRWKIKTTRKDEAGKDVVTELDVVWSDDDNIAMDDGTKKVLYFTRRKK